MPSSHVVHAGVADHDHLVDPLGEHARVPADLLDVLVEEPDDARLELAQVAGSNWAKAMRDMRSPPKTACGLRLDTEASCFAEASSISVVTNAGGPDVDGEAEDHEMRVAGLDGEDAADRRKRPSPPPHARGGRGAGSSGPRESSHRRSGRRRRGRPPRSDVWWCSSVGSVTRTSRLVTPASMVTGIGAPAGRLAAEDLEALVVHGGETCTVIAPPRGTGRKGGSLRGRARRPTASSSMMVGGGTRPDTNFTRHDVHRPRPPQVASRSTPPACAEARMVTPRST